MIPVIVAGVYILTITSPQGGGRGRGRGSRVTKKGSNKDQNEKLLKKRRKREKIKREMGKKKIEIVKLQNRAENALF